MAGQPTPNVLGCPGSRKLVDQWLGSMGYLPTYKWGMNWGSYNPLILTIY